jgi:hypothetical protein
MPVYCIQRAAVHSKRCAVCFQLVFRISFHPSSSMFLTRTCASAQWHCVALASCNADAALLTSCGLLGSGARIKFKAAPTFKCVTLQMHSQPCCGKPGTLVTATDVDPAVTKCHDHHLQEFPNSFKFVYALCCCVSCNTCSRTVLQSECSTKL